MLIPVQLSKTVTPVFIGKTENPVLHIEIDNPTEQEIELNKLVLSAEGTTNPEAVERINVFFYGSV